MAIQPMPISRKGYEQLEIDLNYLKNVRRAEIASRLQEFREEGGDPGESAEYADAIMEQSRIESKIQQIEERLSRAMIIEDADKEHQTDEVRLNSVVTVQEDDFDPETYHILGPIEADPRNGKISSESPLGLALMGKKVGDNVIVEAPDGSFEVKVLSIQ